MYYLPEGSRNRLERALHSIDGENMCTHVNDERGGIKILF